MLTELRKRGLGSLEETVPRVVGRVAFEGRRAAVIGALPGRPMSTLYSRRGHTANADRVRADFQSAGAWLAELQRQTAAGRAPVDWTAAWFRVCATGSATTRTSAPISIA